MATLKEIASQPSADLVHSLSLSARFALVFHVFRVVGSRVARYDI